MAKGDTNDVVKRLQAALPPWFPDLAMAPVLNAILVGVGDSFGYVYGLCQFAKLQTRIKTSSGGWLDLTAWDYFGARFRRRSGESDALFGPRILSEILRPRQTRDAIVRVLTDFTGNAPAIFEPWHPGDCGGYGIGTFAYGVAGCYGSLHLANQVFVTAVLANGPGIPNVGGYGVGALGYGVAGEYVDLSQVSGPITDAEIYATIAQTIAAGVTAWVDIVPKLPTPPSGIFIGSDSGLYTADTDHITADAF